MWLPCGCYGVYIAIGGHTWLLQDVYVLGVKKTLLLFFIFNNFLLHSWMIYQILVVHSRWVYNFMGIILEAQVSFSFSLLCIIFKKNFSDFGDFQTLCVRRDSHRESTTCKLVCEMNRAFIPNLGHPIRGSQSMQDLASPMRKGRTFLIPEWKTLVPPKLYP